MEDKERASHLPFCIFNFALLPAFYDAHGRFGWNDSCESESASREEVFVLSLCTLAPACHDEHLQVHHLGKRRFVAFWHDCFYEKQAASVFHRAVTVLQNLYGALFVPVVDN